MGNGDSARKTVGSHVVDLLQNPDTKQGVVDTQREMQKDYFEQLYACASRYPDWKDPFYVVVKTKKEGPLRVAIRRLFWGRKTRPAPDFDLALWQYFPDTSTFKYEWIIPDEFTCKFLLDHEPVLPEEQKELLSLVKKFKHGLLV